mmetsp:Transcript_28239/g.63931  ORF Transcript_28239/g.63931 Transcript_28239/m.63931 type:complete len:229 (-) Transcript_28239:1158-1844(-)
MVCLQASGAVHSRTVTSLTTIEKEGAWLTGRTRTQTGEVRDRAEGEPSSYKVKLYEERPKVRGASWKLIEPLDRTTGGDQKLTTCGDKEQVVGGKIEALSTPQSKESELVTSTSWNVTCCSASLQIPTASLGHTSLARATDTLCGSSCCRWITTGWSMVKTGGWLAQATVATSSREVKSVRWKIALYQEMLRTRVKLPTEFLLVTQYSDPAALRSRATRRERSGASRE